MSETKPPKARKAPRKSARKAATKAATQAKAAAKTKARRGRTAEKQSAAAPRILHLGTGTDAGGAEAVGFSAVGIAPFGAADRAVRDVPERMAAQAVGEAAASGLAVFADLPWRVHGPSSPLLHEEPSWFEPAAAGGDAVADPRAPAQRDARALLAERSELHDGIAAWIAGRAASLAEAGAKGVRLPGLHHAPPAFWSVVVRRVREAAPTMLVIGDGLGGPFSATRDADTAGFDFLMDSSAWWDGLADWFLDQKTTLRTPTLGFPEAPEGDDLSARLPEGVSLAQAAAARTARTLLTSEGLLVPLALLERAGPELARALEPLLSFRRESAWLDRPGRLLRAGTQGGVVRTDTDPRVCRHALAALGADDEDAGLRAAGARFEGFETVAHAGGTSLLRAVPRDAKRDKAPAERASAKRLEALAEARIAIEGVYPAVDSGRFPAKRIVGDELMVGADIFADGHDVLAADLLLTEPAKKKPRRVPLQKGTNDRWGAATTLERMGRARFEIEAWRNLYASWLSEITKKRAAGQDVTLEAIEGQRIVERSLTVVRDAQLTAEEKELAKAVQSGMEKAGEDTPALLAVLTTPGLEALLRRHGERTHATRSDGFEIVVDRRQARFSSWYEMFPRSQSGSQERHGTFDDVIEKLPYVRDLGFDVLYFPPIHPIGRTNMKGKNNTLTPEEDDVGSPYAIGSEEGGHDAIHPQLGTLEDFGRLVKAAEEQGLEIALDFAIQCSPDHPWLKQHPEWFDWRPDGTIKYAENPPKKYEDIVNVHFYRDALPSLWYALRDVVLFWCEQGVRLFRVDNPHTKPYPFWEWMIEEVKARFPDALFLSEAFTRPKVMKRLAKLGFTQSYTYYTWRNTKHELETYVRELTETDTREVMNPNFFVNTPDINPEPLQTNNRAAHVARTILAGTLASSYGVYNGIEIVESTVLPGKEEYLDSEKYEIRVWDMDRPGHIKDEIRLLNRLRRNHPALQDHLTVRFLTAWNDQVTWFAKRTPDLRDYLLFAVTFDYEREQRAPCELPLWEFGLPDDASIEARDLVSGAAFTWHGKMQDITLGPDRPFAAFQLHGPARTDPSPLYADPEARR